MSSDSLHLLVTGGAGFIGSHFVADMVRRGHRVIVLDALTYAGCESNLEAIPPSEAGGEWILVKGNILDRTHVLQLLQAHAISYVVNFAAQSHVDNSIAGPSPFIETNISGTFQLLEACRDYWQNLAGPQRDRFRFLQISTDEVYGSLEGDGAFDEHSPLRPNSPYSASKAAADHLVRAWHTTYGLPAIVTHCTNNYGARQHPEKLIPTMIRCALAGKNLPVYGDGKHIRDWLHVGDHCRGVWVALTQGQPGEIYDFAGHNALSNISLVQRICALLDSKRPLSSGSYADRITFVADRPGHDRRYATDDSKALQQLGFAPSHAFEQALSETIDWYLAHPEWINAMMGKP